VQSEEIPWVKGLARAVELACKHSRLNATVTTEGNKITLSSSHAGIQLRVCGTASDPQFQVFAVPLMEGRQLIHRSLVEVEGKDVVRQCRIATPSDS
jgi:hypothetical protein